MKKFSLLALAVVATVAFFTPVSAKAAVVYTPIGEVGPGVSGIIFPATIDGINHNGIEGTLKANTQLSLNYTLNPTYANSVIDATVGGTFYDDVSSIALTSPAYTFSVASSTVATSATSQALSYLVTISNLSKVGSLSFKTILQTVGFTNYQGLSYATWVTSPATVPLPAALPLFGLGLAGLAGYRRLKKSNKAV